MENASKALIIAGAILLSILIISLGLMVYNNAKDTVQGSDMSEQQIQTFNAKFTSFAGDRVSGSKVNALLQAVLANNQAEDDSGNGRTVTVDGVVTSAEARVSTAKYYAVELGYENAIVSTITITEAN